jgi:hypothetical protein
MSLILPGMTEYYQTIQNLGAWVAASNIKEGQVTIVKPGNEGLPEIVDFKKALEYFYDGELDERLGEIDEYDY